MKCLKCNGECVSWSGFRTVCDTCGDDCPTLVHPYNQSELINRFQSKDRNRYKGGVCEGASMYWISRLLALRKDITVGTVTSNARILALRTNFGTVSKYVTTIMDEQSDFIRNTGPKLIAKWDQELGGNFLLKTGTGGSTKPDTSTKTTGGRAVHMIAINQRHLVLKDKVAAICHENGFGQQGWEMKGSLSQFASSSSSTRTRLELQDRFLMFKASSDPVLVLFSIGGSAGGHAMALCFTRNFINRKGLIFFDPNKGEIFYNSLLDAFGKDAEFGVFDYLKRAYRGLNEMYYGQIIGLKGASQAL